MRICNTEQRVVQGLENGKTGSGFRYIFPLNHNGRHLGSVEVGVTVKSILDALRELDPQREYAYVLSKKLAEAHLFPEQQWLYSQADIHPDYLIEDVNAVLPDSPAPLSSVATELNRLLKSRPEVQRAMHDGQPLTVSAMLLDLPYTVSLLPMHDVGQRLSGYLITYSQDPLIGKLQQEFFLLIGSAFAALALIFTLIWRLRIRTHALAASKLDLEATYETLAEGVYVQNREGIITAVNPAACSLLGYSREEMLGQEAHDLFHRDADRGKTPKDECPFHRHVRKGESYDGEELFAAKDGRMLTVEVASRPIFHQGRVVSSVTAFHDITQRKQTESNLRRSEETGRKLSAAVEQSPVSVVITDTHGTIEYVNAKFVEQSGYTIEEALGQNPRFMKSGLVPDAVYVDLWATITAGREWRGELQNRHKDGSLYWVKATVVPIKDKQGKITEFMSVRNDISEIIKLHEEIESTQQEIIYHMGEIAESRSQETGNHVRRVAEYSRLLALKYGLDAQEANKIAMASPMHDIGKVGIPDAILHKPGKLTDEEWEIMKTHAMLGYAVLQHSKRPILQASAIIAKEHHEKYDGTGYPLGLSGEAIHLYARIVAIADVFDALSHDRCYKKAWEDANVFAFFEKERGTHFDPNLVDMFLAAKEEFLTIRNHFKDALNP